MVGSFSGINTALSGLRYHQVALDVAGNNVSNASTDGYVRRRVTADSVGGPAQPALWSRYDGHGDGVRVAGVDRMVDALLDARVRRENGTLSYLRTSQTVLQRVEAGIGEPGATGVAAALTDFRKSWQDLANNPGGDAARQQVLGRAATLAQAVRVQAANVTNEASDQRVHVMSAVSEINTAAKDLAALNASILTTEANGTDANTLHDTRDQLALRLAELAGGVVTVQSNGMFDVTVNGVALVSGKAAGQLAVTGGIAPDGSAAPGDVAFAVTGLAGAPEPVTVTTGELGAVVDVLTTRLPSYLSGLDAIASQLAAAVNAQHDDGFTATGAAGAAFFTFDPANAAATLAVAITDPAAVAASRVAGPANEDGSNADAMVDVFGPVEDGYQRLVNTFGTTVAAVERQTANQAALAGAVNDAWEQQAGVNLDEETVNMVMAQRAYEASARVMTVIDEVLDTLINRTGLVGR